MIDTATYRMAEALAGTELAPILYDLRTVRKRSFNQIARDLFVDHRIEVTPQTVANWCAELDIQKAS